MVLNRHHTRHARGTGRGLHCGGMERIDAGGGGMAITVASASGPRQDRAPAPAS